MYFEEDIYGEKANTAIDKIIAAISFLPIGNIYKVNKVMLSGLIKGEQKIFKVVGETVDWAENVDKEVIEKLSKVGEQSDAIIKNFWDEFGENQEKLQRLIDNPSLIEEWIAKNGAAAAKGGFSNFTNLDDLAKMFKGKNLGNAADDLLNSGWTKVEGNWGSKTIFQKQIGKDRFYAIWESANMEHSINNLPTSYWKLTKGKISAYGDNVRRVSDAANFKQ